ncbi:MAG: alpha/beta fold hydrolase, partial [Promethearchaeia archaeon]
LDHLSWEQDLLFVGHSLGGMVALVYALENEDSVDRMVICSSYCYVSDEATTEVLGRVKGNALKDFAMGIGKRGLSPYDEEDAKWIAKQVTGHLSKKDAMLATAASAKFNICEHLRDLDIPTLLVVGEDDITTPVWASEMLHEWLPNSELSIIPEAGHMVIIDHHDEFNSHAISFLS